MSQRDYKYGRLWQTADDSGNIGPEHYDVELRFKEQYPAGGRTYKVFVRGIKAGTATSDKQMSGGRYWRGTIDMVLSTEVRCVPQNKKPEGLARTIAESFGIHF